MKLIGIDVGTGGTRVLLVDTAGKVVGSTVREHAPFRSPQPGWAEQDPEDWWQAAVHAIPALLKATKTAPEEIAAVGLSGQMHGAVLLDATDRRPPSCAHLVRSENRSRSRMVDYAAWCEASDPAHLQPSTDQFHV